MSKKVQSKRNCFLLGRLIDLLGNLLKVEPGCFFKVSPVSMPRGLPIRSEEKYL